jgi:copper chaperone CopZ
VNVRLLCHKEKAVSRVLSKSDLVTKFDVSLNDQKVVVSAKENVSSDQILGILLKTGKPSKLLNE